MERRELPYYGNATARGALAGLSAYARQPARGPTMLAHVVAMLAYVGLCWPMLAYLAGTAKKALYVGPCWGYVGPSWGLCWPSLGLCWPILGAMLAQLGAMLAHLEAYVGPC